MGDLPIVQTLVQAMIVRLDRSGRERQRLHKKVSLLDCVLLFENWKCQPHATLQYLICFLAICLIVFLQSRLPPLHAAAFGGHQHIMEYLLDLGRNRQTDHEIILELVDPDHRSEVRVWFTMMKHHCVRQG